MRTFTVSSKPSTHFTTAIGVNKKETEDISGINKSGSIRSYVVTGVAVTTQNIGRQCDVAFYSDANFSNTTTLTADSFVAAIKFPFADFWKVSDGASTQDCWQQYVQPTVPFEVVNKSATDHWMHLAFINRSSTAKGATKSGLVKVSVYYENPKGY